MTLPQPSKLAIALLTRLVPDNEPLIGDLLEEFHVRRSQLWLLTQVLVAIVFSSRQHDRDIRPLKLQEIDLLLEPRALPHRTRRISLCGSPVEGIGGLGIVALGALVTIVLPQAWWVVLATLLAGIALGVLLIVITRRRTLNAPARPTRVLFG
jgi:hypothetical protein